MLEKILCKAKAFVKTVIVLFTGDKQSKLLGGNSLRSKKFYAKLKLFDTTSTAGGLVITNKSRLFY